LSRDRHFGLIEGLQRLIGELACPEGVPLGGRKRASGLSENPIRRKIEWWTGFPD
jgi:hypothetical protein